MFGSNRNNNKEAVRASMLPKTGSGGLNSLVKGTVMEGNITAESDFRVDGKIKGTLVCKAKVIIGPSGSVEGEIRCQSAMIEGHLEGKITVSEILNIRETASVNGEVKTNKLIVQSGAGFNVTCVMGDQQPITTTNAPAAARNNGKPSSKKAVRETVKVTA